MLITTVSPMRLVAMVLLSFLACLPASATEFMRPRPLTEYGDILLAQELDTAINALNDRMTQCIDSGAGSPPECFCRHAGEAGIAKTAYEKVLQARPKWKGKILYWKNMENQASHNLIMPAIDHQLRSSTAECGPRPQ